MTVKNVCNFLPQLAQRESEEESARERLNEKEGGVLENPCFSFFFLEMDILVYSLRKGDYLNTFQVLIGTILTCLHLTLLTHPCTTRHWSRSIWQVVVSHLVFFSCGRSCQNEFPSEFLFIKSYPILPLSLSLWLSLCYLPFVNLL